MGKDTREKGRGGDDEGWREERVEIRGKFLRRMGEAEVQYSAVGLEEIDGWSVVTWRKVERGEGGGKKNE